MMFARATKGLRVALCAFLFALAFLLADMRVAHADPGEVPAVPTNPIPSACSDGIDNDDDGLIDFVPLFGDPDCDSIFDSSEGGSTGGGGGGPSVPSVTECSDGIDNDGDGLIDFVPSVGDPDCASLSDSSETASGGGDDGGGSGDDEGGDTGGGDTGGGDTGGADGSGGNGGGPAAVCEDSIDNDGDSLVDMDDPGCDSPGDHDESSGGSGGGIAASGGTLAVGSAATAEETMGEVLGTSTTTEVIACDAYLTAFIKFGAANDAEQVMRLQKVLKDYEGADVDENGVYDSATLSAVHAFQTKYADEILAPWGIRTSTGFVYLTTRKKMNEIRCEGRTTFPLTDEERRKIEETRASAIVTDERGVVPAPTKSTEKKVEVPVKTEVKTTGTKKVTDKSSEETVQSSGLKRAWDFLGRLFNRGR